MTWELIDHACCGCFGRLLEAVDTQPGGETHRRYRCAECGKLGQDTALSICCCGVKVGGRFGLECIANPARTQEVPQEVLVRQRPEQKTVREQTVPARVEIGEFR